MTALVTVTVVSLIRERSFSPSGMGRNRDPNTAIVSLSPRVERSARGACEIFMARIITSEREARSEFLLIYTKNLSMSGPPARRPAGRGHAFERFISLEP